MGPALKSWKCDAVMNCGKKYFLLFFCPEKVAIVVISGIITTNLGKTATLTGVAGREKTDTSLQNMPFSQTGEGHFFWPVSFQMHENKK